MAQKQSEMRFDAAHARQLLFERMSRRVAGPANDLSKLATALRLMGEQFEWSPAANFVERAADELQRMATFIRDADADRVLREMRGLAQRKPALFIAGALLVGFGGGRFLRSSAAPDEREPFDPSIAGKMAGPPREKPKRTQRKRGASAVRNRANNGSN